MRNLSSREQTTPLGRSALSPVGFLQEDHASVAKHPADRRFLVHGALRVGAQQPADVPSGKADAPFAASSRQGTQQRVDRSQVTQLAPSGPGARPRSSKKRP